MTSEREDAVVFDHLDWLCDAAYNHAGCHELGYNPVKYVRETIAALRSALTTAERERDEARRERDAALEAVRLALTELDWQMEAQSRCGEYGAECPLQDAGKWNSEHMEARVACRRALDAAEGSNA